MPLISKRLPNILNREWMLPSPASQIHKVSINKQWGSGSDPGLYSVSTNPALNAEAGSGSFYVVRDDLLHPLINGNKSRKLDALLPILTRHAASDVITCGGAQSAHAAAIAVSCAERGIRSHLLLRGEQPEIPTGYNLVSLMYGNVTCVPRSVYAQREDMLYKHADEVAGSDGSVIRVDDILGSTSTMTDKDNSKKVVVVNEGAADVVGLLGVIRLVIYLSHAHVFGTEQRMNIVVDAGTGATAIGLALGALYLGLPWKVTAVMLADTLDGYKAKEKSLISDFSKIYSLNILEEKEDRADAGIVHWVDRVHPRRFGKVLKGEIDSCRNVSMQTGILLDPVYTLAAWEQSSLLSLSESDAKTVMLHTGGTLGLFGLAQRYPSEFCTTR